MRWGTDQILAENCALNGIFSNGNSSQRRATFLLVGQEHAHIEMEKAGYLVLARSASDPRVRERFIAIAKHYRSLAKIEQSIADQRRNKNGCN
jgi:hypothetical protein